MRLVFAAAALSLLAGCASGGSFQSSPVSVGGGPNALKRTPCACLEKQQPAGLPKFLGNSKIIQTKVSA